MSDCVCVNECSGRHPVFLVSMRRVQEGCKETQVMIIWILGLDICLSLLLGREARVRLIKTPGGKCPSALEQDIQEDARVEGRKQADIASKGHCILLRACHACLRYFRVQYSRRAGALKGRCSGRLW